jgi:hypothetical protein
VVVALDGSKQAKATMKKQHEGLVKMAELLGHYVEATCNNDPVTFTSSGFAIRSTTAFHRNRLPNRRFSVSIKARRANCWWISPLYRKRVRMTSVTRQAVRVELFQPRLHPSRSQAPGRQFRCLMVAYAYAAQYPNDIEKLALLDAPLPGVGDIWEKIYTTSALWHFHFVNSPIALELVKGRERIFLEHLWQTLSPHPETFSDMLGPTWLRPSVPDRPR